MRIKLLVLLLVTLSLSAAILLGTPRTAAACTCLGGGSTSEYTGSGASCNEAASDWYHQAQTEATATCSPDEVCGNSFQVTVSCQLNPDTGLYQETGYERFRCLICP
jgi:hypothetical protein